jgi:hypothetical protein
MGIDMSISCVECVESTDSNESEILDDEMAVNQKSPPAYSLHNPSSPPSHTQPTQHSSLTMELQPQPADLKQSNSQSLETGSKIAKKEPPDLAEANNKNSSLSSSTSQSKVSESLAENASPPTAQEQQDSTDNEVPKEIPNDHDLSICIKDPQETSKFGELAKKNVSPATPSVLALDKNENQSSESWGDFQSVELSDCEVSPRSDGDAASPSASLPSEAEQDLVPEKTSSPQSHLPPLTDSSPITNEDPESSAVFPDSSTASPSEHSELDAFPPHTALQNPNPSKDLSQSLSSLSQDSCNDSLGPLPLSPNKSPAFPIPSQYIDDLSVSSHHSGFSHRSASSSTSQSSKRMIICERCHQTLPRHAFSAIQLKKKIHRVCKQCLNGDVYVL